MLNFQDFCFFQVQPFVISNKDRHGLKIIIRGILYSSTTTRGQNLLSKCFGGPLHN